ASKVLTPPGATTFGTAVGDIAVGPDGNLWFTEPASAQSGHNFIGRLTLPGTFTELPVCASPFSIAAGPDGNLWSTTSTIGGRIPPAGAVTEFGGALPVLDIAAVGTGRDLWFAEENSVLQDGSIGRITAP